MTAITASLVNQLRQATNVSMMECKRALTDAGGDIDKAIRLLRERGVAMAAKKATRATNQGLVASFTTPDNRTASLVEVNCETDFVARNASFQSFVQTLAEKAAGTDAALSESVKDLVVAKVTEIGENISIRRNTRFVVQGTGRVGAYIHLGGKLGILVEVNCTKTETLGQDAFTTLIRDLTLHIAACKPQYLKPDEVPADVITSEREIYAKQVTGKPANVVEKIVDGKLRKYFEEICLLQQPFVKEPKQTITALLEACGKTVGDTLSIRRYTIYQLGA